jgi:Polyketide synthase dehydratase
VIDRATDVDVVIYQEESNLIAYEICGRGEGEAGGLVYSQGTAQLVSQAMPSEEVRLEVLQTRMNLAGASVEQCYQVYQGMGLHYGPAQRALNVLYTSDTGDELLARLELPQSVVATLADYTLHPSLLDAALQASIGLELSNQNEAKLALPFALDRIDILKPCTTTMWAWVRASAEATQAGVRKLDITVFDATGAVSARLVGFTARVLEGGLGEQSAPKVLMVYPEWTTETQSELNRSPSNTRAWQLNCSKWFRSNCA